MSQAPTLACTDDARRDLVRAKPLDGIDYVEVEVFEHDGDLRPHPYLCVHFLSEIPPDIGVANVRITGGRRVPAEQIHVIDVQRQITPDPEEDDCLRILLDRAGDRSRYTLSIVDAENGRPGHTRHRTFDERYFQADFSFGVDCPSTLDCRTETACPPARRDEPTIDYLAKDYASFRQLLLDRLALLLPQWRERHVPDLGLTLVELLAYVADHLSYYQDAVATEAYLDTARLRISVRRHARLVDYRMHEGCNARAWVCVETDMDFPLDPKSSFFVTGDDVQLRLPHRVLTLEDLGNVPSGLYEVFEPVASGKLRVHAALSRIPFYTWQDRQCCLPRGATAATLLDAWIDRPSPDARRQLDGLEVGSVLVFEEVLGPQTAADVDADPTHRHAVCLTTVTRSIDRLTDTPVLEIAWAPEDALPFPLCLSVLTPAPDCRLVDVSVARGNVILVDHGRSVEEALGMVEVEEALERCEAEGQPSELVERARRFRPMLTGAPLTFAVPVHDTLPASSAIEQDARAAVPQLGLVGDPPRRDPRYWIPVRDLLGSGATDDHFVAEVDDDGRAHLRFGDGELGREPVAGTAFVAGYRIGNGTAGNVGPEAISRLVLRDESIGGATLRVRNPLPARGGIDPEPIADVKRLAPYAFHNRVERAITPEDYARLAQGSPAIQRAAAVLRWSGSWYEAHVTVDPTATEEPAPGLLAGVAEQLAGYRRLGHDLVVSKADYVPLRTKLVVWVRPHYLRGDVEGEVRAVLSNRELPDGRRGFFHPDTFTFGTGIALGKLVASVQAVEGVESVVVETFAALHEPDRDGLADGFLALGPREIAQLDADPDFPDRGELVLQLEVDDDGAVRLLSGHRPSRAACAGESAGPLRARVPRGHVRHHPRFDVGVARKHLDRRRLRGDRRRRKAGRGSDVSARRPEHPRHGRFRDRAAGRLGDDRRRADLLSGAHRQRGVPAYGDRAPLGARARPVGRLSAAPRCRRERRPRVRARQGRARHAPEGQPGADPARARRATAVLRNERGARGARRVERARRPHDEAAVDRARGARGSRDALVRRHWHQPAPRRSPAAHLRAERRATRRPDAVRAVGHARSRDEPNRRDGRRDAAHAAAARTTPAAGWHVAAPTPAASPTSAASTPTVGGQRSGRRGREAPLVAGHLDPRRVEPPHGDRRPSHVRSARGAAASRSDHAKGVTCRERVGVFPKAPAPKHAAPTSPEEIRRAVVSEVAARLFTRFNPELGDTLYTAWSTTTVTPSSGLCHVYAFRTKAALFGHNLGEFEPISGEDKFEKKNPPTSLKTAWEGTVAGATPTTKILLDAEYDGIVEDSWVAISAPATPEADAYSFHRVASTRSVSVSAGVVGMRVTEVTLQDPVDRFEELKEETFLLRDTTVYVRTEALDPGEEPITQDVSGPLLELDRPYQGLDAGRWLIVCGERTDVEVRDDQGVSIAQVTGIHGAERVMIVTVAHKAGGEQDAAGDRTYTVLGVSPPLTHSYKRDTVRVYGNVVHATHGESRDEILGGGDGGQSQQQFTLKQPPVAYLPAPTPDGATSTLQVFVNDVEWHEAPNLYVLGPTDRRFITTIDDAGKSTVVFGTGVYGARVPTGLENVRARYRMGLGRGGNAPAGRVSLLATRPLGVKGVTNPIRASGGADAETRDQARANAPLGVTALGRLVSVPDYAAFARTFAGVGKAAAIRLSDHQREVVHLTIAGADDVPIDSGSDLFQSLRRALAAAGDSSTPVVVAVRELLAIVVGAKVRLQPDHLWEKVEPRLRAALLDAFGFERSDLGQDVILSQLVATMQGVEGVDWVDVDFFGAISETNPDTGEPRSPADILAAVDAMQLEPRIHVAQARLGSSGIRPAQLAYLPPDLPETLILTPVLP